MEAETDAQNRQDIYPFSAIIVLIWQLDARLACSFDKAHPILKPNVAMRILRWVSAAPLPNLREHCRARMHRDAGIASLLTFQYTPLQTLLADRTNTVRVDGLQLKVNPAGRPIVISAVALCSTGPTDALLPSPKATLALMA